MIVPKLRLRLWQVLDVAYRDESVDFSENFTDAKSSCPFQEWSYSSTGLAKKCEFSVKKLRIKGITRLPETDVEEI
jgi:hypothetical protein